MKPYSKLSTKDKEIHTMKGVLNYNHFTLSNAVQNLISNNYDVFLHTDVNRCVEKCIKELDDIFIKHSKPPVHENKTEKHISENA